MEKWKKTAVLYIVKYRATPTPFYEPINPLPVATAIGETRKYYFLAEE